MRRTRTVYAPNLLEGVFYELHATVERIEAWEDGRGGPVSLDIRRYTFGLAEALLELVLPRITCLQMGREARYFVKPPVPNWRDVLRSWRTYITNPVEWEPFVEYVGEIEDLLFHEYPGATRFNSRFKERLEAFSEDQLSTLQQILHKIADSQQLRRRVQLTEDELILFQRAQETVGDLQVGSVPVREPWRIDSVVLSSD